MAKTLTLTGIRDFWNTMSPHQRALALAIERRYAEQYNDTALPDWVPVFQNVLAIGGKGSGKTIAGAYTIAHLAINTPDGMGVIVRKRHEQLRNTFLADFYAMLDQFTKCSDPECPKGKDPHGHREALVIKEGEKDGAVEVYVHTIMPGHPCKLIFRIEPEGDDRTVADSFKSYNLNFFLLEEASQLNEQTFIELCDRLRRPQPWRNGPPVYRGYVLSNPTTKSYWLAKLASKYEQQMLAYNPRQSDDPIHNQIPEGLVIRSKLTDNPWLPIDYVEQVKRRYINDPVKYDMFVNGIDGIDIEGRPVFSGHFDRSQNVSEHVRFASDRPLIRGWDFGYHNPACVFAQETEQGGLNVLAEFRLQNVYIEEFVDAVKKYTVEHFPYAGRDGRFIRDFGDYAGTQQTDKEHTTIQRAHQRGVTILTRPNTKIESGLDVLRKLMSEGYKMPIAAQLGAAGEAMSRRRLRIHPRCEELIDAIAYGYHYQVYKNGQESTTPKKDNKYDHIIDALRYLTINTFGLADDAGSTGGARKVYAKTGRKLYQDR